MTRPRARLRRWISFMGYGPRSPAARTPWHTSARLRSRCCSTCSNRPGSAGSPCGAFTGYASSWRSLSRHRSANSPPRRCWTGWWRPTGGPFKPRRTKFRPNSEMAEHQSSDNWIGARLLRKEDRRHLLGAGQFVADIRLPGLKDVAFVRSQMAHARVRQVRKPEASADCVFTLADLGPIKVLEAGPELATFRHGPYPPLADERVRYVGQTIAACVRPTRAEAEDLADQVTV